jgi:hypothetical protein
MTEAELAAVVRGIAPMVREQIAHAMSEQSARVLMVEARLTALEEELDALDTSTETQDAAFTKELGAVRERVAVVEVRPMPQGAPGPAGKDGADGKDGEPGKAGLTYQFVYQDGKAYDAGDVVTWAGSTWHCNEATETKPGDGSKAWTLMVKRGRDGRDGQNAPGALPIVKVGGTR